MWTAGKDRRLPNSIGRKIADLSNDVYVSDVSVWEMAVKARLGKLQFDEGLAAFVAREFHLNRYVALPIRRAHLFQTERLPLIHRDPFDRLLIAQAIEENLPILTRDSQIKQYPVETIW